MDNSIVKTMNTAEIATEITADESLKLSVVIPAYNEEDRIGLTLEHVAEYLDKQTYRAEVIVVDDGSSDQTCACVSTYKKRIKNLTIISFEKNRGKGSAVRTGMLASSGEYCLFMDADNSVSIDHLEQFWDKVEDNHIVIGSINLGQSNVNENSGILRRTLGTGAKQIIKLAVSPGVEDTQRGFKLFQREAAHKVFSLQTIEGFSFDIEVILIARLHNYKIHEAPVNWNNPAGSKVSARHYFTSLYELALIKSRQWRSKYKRSVSPEELLLELRKDIVIIKA